MARRYKELTELEAKAVYRRKKLVMLPRLWKRSVAVLRTLSSACENPPVSQVGFEDGLVPGLKG